MKLVNNKTVIVTGGARGIGKACCIAFAKEGANVVFTYNKSTKDAAALKKQIQQENAKFLAVQADVRNYEQCRAVVEKAVKKFGRIDVVINNAGIIRDKVLFMMQEEDWQEVICTNLGGTYHMTRAAIVSLLKQKEGCIINISSVSGITGLPGQSNYSASKAGIIGFSKALAKEAASCNVRVNVVCPGYINTDMVGYMNDETAKKLSASIPLKRFGDPREVADLCVFLASDKAKYITGETIRIDGGLAI